MFWSVFFNRIAYTGRETRARQKMIPIRPLATRYKLQVLATWYPRYWPHEPYDSTTPLKSNSKYAIYDTFLHEYKYIFIHFFAFFFLQVHICMLKKLQQTCFNWLCQNNAKFSWDRGTTWLLHYLSPKLLLNTLHNSALVTHLPPKNINKNKKETVW